MGIPGIPTGLLAIRPWPATGLGPRPELTDLARLAGRALSLAAARGQDAPVQRALAAHLGPQAAGWPVLTATWPAFGQVDVQAGIDACLAGPGVRHDLLGLTGARHRHAGLADLTAGDPSRSPGGVPGLGSVTARTWASARSSPTSGPAANQDGRGGPQTRCLLPHRLGTP